jgi:radical SAM superfamily enzyme YgiQ (UPF0313 family)
MSKIDVLFVSNTNQSETYQNLHFHLSASEPPTWSLLLAQSCRSIGHKVQILDVAAENLSIDEACSRILDADPRFICFVVYGQNVNAGTVNMSGNIKLSNKLKETQCNIPIGFIGSYVQALPKKALLDEPSIDIVFMNEGVYALRNLLSLPEIDIHNLSEIKGLAWRKNNEVVFNEPEIIVPNERMDIDLPGYAWDLLPFKEKPFDLYRSPLWHAEYDEDLRTPYAAIQTSLGCQFGCSFCMINILNRNDNEEIGVASNYSKMRFWSPEFIFQEFMKLYEMGVRTIKITDEMFLLNKKYYEPLCKLLDKSGIGKELRLWAYSRVDTIRDPDLLKLLRRAGIKWLALGIESSDKKVRLEVTKGKFEDVDILKVVKQIEDADINIMANYIFGLPGDTLESMTKTLEFSQELNTCGWNAYPALALPGSKLYKDSIDNNLDVPKEYEQFAFLGKKALPMYNENLTRKQILEFRDNAFKLYHSSEKFLQKVNEKFGNNASSTVNKILDFEITRN